jgi:hypothetical protein
MYNSGFVGCGLLTVGPLETISTVKFSGLADSFFLTGPYGLNHMVRIANGGAGQDLRISLHTPVAECIVIILVQGQ